MTSARSASIALSLLLLLTNFATSPASPLFASAFLSFDTGGDSRGVAVGDLNGDGKPDLATANFETNTVSVLLGNGDGTFGARTDFGAGPDPAAIAIADVNRDGKLDLVVVNETTAEVPAGGSFVNGTVSVLLGNGDGTFGPKTDFGTGKLPISVGIGDLDGDGDLDLVVGNSYSHTVSVLLGNGDGGFAPKSDLGIPGGSVALADLNADGKPDLVVGSGGIAILLGNGDGTFGPRTDYEGGPLVSVGDMNSDGKPDLVAGTGGNASTVSVRLGNGDGTFGAKQDFLLGTHYVRLVAIADLNGDGAPDVVTDKSVLLGRGDGTLGPEIPFMTAGASAIAVSDLNADGKTDITATGYFVVSVLLGNGDGTFGAKTEFPAGADPTSVTIAQLNADGKPDLALSDIDENAVSVLLGNGDGTFEARTAYGTGRNPNQVAVGDLNADGKADLVTANFGYGTNTVSVLLGNGDGTFGSKTDLGTASTAASVAIGDLNADGKPDLVVANLNTSGSVSALLGNGDGTFQSRRDFGTGVSTNCVAVQDLNMDGKPDIIALNLGSNNSSVSVLLGNGDGTFGPRTDFATGHPPSNWVAVGDLNGDGKLDLAVANSGDYSLSVPIGNVSVLLGNGDATFQTKTDYVTGFGSASVAIGDLNADAKPDLAVANYLTNTVSVLLGNGDGTFGAKMDYGTGDGPRSVAIGDLNGDGKPEIVSSNADAGTVTVLRNLGPSAPPLSARAFLVGDRTIPLGSGPSNVCVQIEPVNGSFALPDVDLSSLSMVSEGTGSVSRINATVSRGSPRSDLDHDGVAEISACFSRGELAKLFSSIQDRRDVEVALQGKLAAGRQFAAALQLTIKAKPVNGRRLAASFWPNPMNPSGVLRLTTSARGYVSVRLFDLSGRLVRTVARAQIFDAGDHAFALDGRDDRGAALARGVYFYRIESPDGMTTGRFAIVK